MDYDKCYDLLAASEEIKRIPTGWKQEVPVFETEGDNRKAAFIFSQVKDGKMEVKEMLSVSDENEDISLTEPEELQKKLGLDSLLFDAPEVDDYDRYFDNCDRYEDLFAEIAEEGDTASPEAVEEYLNLLQELFSEDAYKNLVYPLAAELLDRLAEALEEESTEEETSEELLYNVNTNKNISK